MPPPVMTPSWFAQLPVPPVRSPVRLERLAWPDAAHTLQDVLLLPVGAMEQHGPHLPLHTDTVIAESTCQLASALTGAPVLPALGYSVSLGHTVKWPGTFSLFHETLMLTVREIAQWAADTGWNRLLIVNSHYGNDAALRCAVDRLRHDLGGNLLTATRNTWDLTPEIAGRFTHDAADWHANEAETSLMLFLDPAAVVKERLSTADDPDRTMGCVFPHRVAHTSLNGVTGRPSLGTVEQGALLISRMGDALADLIQKARVEHPPLTWAP
ncbi:creatininase family protein [Verrucomicrobium spinosum]|uniref:creatininase family protein n=2 Tax=Verrucomicrobium spinosum TaxID=2736 RepID=UPI0012E115DF|nr:creatininase family protein [Verrucomicrobium spinosum]